MRVQLQVAALAATIACALPASAQTDLRPTGIAMTGGAGVGWTRPACDFCRRQRAAGPMFFLQMAGHLTPTVALGAEADFWARDDEVFELTGAIGLVAYLYPTPGGAFHVKGGLSYLSYRLYDDDGDLVSNMPAIQLGAGYRFTVSDRVALTNFVNFVAARFGSLRSEDAVLVDNMGITSLQLGLAITRF